MGMITLDDLRQYQAMNYYIESLRAEKNACYFPIYSPAIDGSGHGTTPGNPTESAVNKIANLDEIIDRETLELQQKVEQIHLWLETVPEYDIRAIINWHFLLGLTWAETARHLYTGYTGDTCRMRIKRYFDENK